MKFKYDIKNKYYKMYGEANYLVAYKKKYLNNYNKTIKNYINTLFTLLFLNIILIFFWLIIGNKYIISLLIFTGLVFLFYTIFALLSYFKYKNSNHKGEIIIDKNGITDKSDINVTFSWDKLELIGLTNSTLIIVLDSPFVIILEPNEKIISEIKKYKDVKVIRQTS